MFGPSHFLSESLTKLLLLLLLGAVATAQEAPRPWDQYLQARTTALATNSQIELSQVTAANWPETQKQWRAQLQEMLGLMPWPERTELKPKVTFARDRDGYRVSNVVFQARPGLYVTANLYEPAAQARPRVGQPCCMSAGTRTFVTKVAC